MKIFFNDRIIWFVKSKPDRITETDVYIVYDSPVNLKNSFKHFESDTTCKNLFIQYQSNMDISSAILSFLSLFKIVEAAGGVVKNEKGEILFIYRSGFWDLPKGKISRNDRLYVKSHCSGYPEKPAAARIAAIREVKEETGLLTVDITRELIPTWHIYYIKQKRILKHTLWFEMAADSFQPLTPQIKENITEVRWVPPEELNEIRQKSYASLGELF